MVCIYCKKSDTETAFNTREHILPKTLGGLIRLPIGYVCDKCNKDFSILEKRFVYDSHIAIFKQFSGPSGRRGPFKTNLHFLSGRNSEKLLGFMEQGGIPRVADQILMRNGLFQFYTDGTNQNIYQEKFSHLFNSLKQEKVIYIYDEQVLPNEYYLSLYKDKLLAFINDKEDKDGFAAFIEQFKDKEGILDLSNGSPKISKSPVVSHQKQGFSLIDFNRIIAKIVFNGLAHYYGTDYILSPEFDNLRSFIRYGDNGFNFVAMKSEDKPTLRESLSLLKIPTNSHILVCGGIGPNSIIGTLSLYDGFLEYAVRTDKEVKIKSKSIRIFEFNNKKEYDTEP